MRRCSTRGCHGRASGAAGGGDRAFAVLREAADGRRDAAEGRRPPSLMMALHIWSMAHGIASLFVQDGPSRRKLPMAAEDLLEAGVLLYLQRPRRPARQVRPALSMRSTRHARAGEHPRQLPQTLLP